MLFGRSNGHGWIREPEQDASSVKKRYQTRVHSLESLYTIDWRMQGSMPSRFVRLPCHGVQQDWNILSPC
jgi:hypothetical protein